MDEQCVSLKNHFSPTHHVFNALAWWLNLYTKFKIAYAVVLAIPVLMVNDLIRQEWSPQMFFHNETVLQNIFMAKRVINHNITTTTDKTTALSTRTPSMTFSSQASTREFESADKFVTHGVACFSAFAQTGPKRPIMSSFLFSSNDQSSEFFSNQIVFSTHCCVPKSTSVSPGVKTSAVKRYVTEENTGASLVVERVMYPAHLHAVTVMCPYIEVKE